jgi:uncharacterized membrane protein
MKNNPIKPTLKTEIVPIIFLLISIVLSFYFYAHLPQRVVTHWNAAGEPDGYSSRAFAAFFFPFFNLAIYLLMLFIPYLDPKKSNYEKFINIYHIVKGALVVFLSVIYFIISLNGLGYKIPVNLAIPVGIGILFIIIGYYLKGVKPNWFFGIRTPWTLSSDRVWEKTHNFGSKIFMISGLLMLLVVIFPNWFLWLMGLFVVLILSTVIYSYLIYRK